MDKCSFPSLYRRKAFLISSYVANCNTCMGGGESGGGGRGEVCVHVRGCECVGVGERVGVCVCI